MKLHLCGGDLWISHRNRTPSSSSLELAMHHLSFFCSLLACTGENIIEKQQNILPTIGIQSHSDDAVIIEGYIESFPAQVSDDNRFDFLNLQIWKLLDSNFIDLITRYRCNSTPRWLGMTSISLRFHTFTPNSWTCCLCLFWADLVYRGPILF